MVTIRDIAKQAGVSASTASRALNKNPHISQATIKKVQQIADKLGYLPDYNAKNLTTGEASAIGVVFPVGGNGMPGNPFYVNVLTGINKELVKRGYALSVAITKSIEELEKNVKSMVYQSKIKKFILLYSQANDPIAKFLRQENLRFVVIGQPIESGDYFVDNNNVEVGRVATEFLAEKAHVTHFGFVHSENNWIYEQQRFAGFKKAIDGLGLQYIEMTLKTGSDQDLVKDIKSVPQLDGVVATDDLNAIAFYDVYTQQKNKTDITVMGFNNSVPSIMFDHNFHTVDLYPEEMGSKAALLIFSDRENAEIDQQRQLQVGYQII
ncbi:LacI family DNA-binding transcriptional regulator [Companilactobacillus versmoldensis]|uniref:LacI family transcriptional regulator n=1 Tax=Companilactobacillus versmoldensis DSM 14857 = KCTC 3814 TaxID=1423815 RepID=A0A0R1SP03_9LACO|nr:LacI family DNA-binding transcriptional regulator [Companilactobacillus versmoldensis]KRL68458.1 LacI family transcriptional regulator [Companilactobacillus versmoldensis DSM 14857 = KCTC 3814]